MNSPAEAPRAPGAPLRLWHQSFTVLGDVPHYHAALQRHLVQALGDPRTTIDLHGMAPGTYPSDYPGSHIGYAYLFGLHKEQFVHAALQAEQQGYDAFMIATIPDTAFEEVRSLVDIPVVTFGQASVLAAAQLGDCVGIVNFIGALVPQLRRNFEHYRLDRLVGPIVQVAAEFTDIMAAYADPGPLLGAFTDAARRAIAAGATVIVPGEGPLNVFLADRGIVEVDGVPVVDSLGTLAATAELRAREHQRSGLKPGRTGFFGTRPDPDLVRAAREFYGIPQSLDAHQP
ncbi:aspartate/glutamate racemase family protein [Propionibacteriaceae bacterium G57]|uniref:aspartate/glutamate racemase family protein n=1 Tax=Aestuariimicrobium sp. G57 TaxID=3418485 RepID=UPI003DA792EC